MKIPRISGTVKISILYGIAFILWIFFRNRIFYLWEKTDVIYTSGQTTIDLIFGFTTALSIFFLIRYFKVRLHYKTNELTNIIDNTTAVIFAKKKDGKYIFVNRHFEQIFNYKNSEVIGKTDREIFPSKFAEVFMTNDQEIFEVEKTIEYEETGPERDGTHTYLSIKFPIRDLSGKVYAMGGVSTDITQRKKIEKELKYSLALSNATLESTADGILVVDSEGNISGKNRKFIEMWKIPSELDKSHDDSKLLKFVLDQLISPEQFLEKVNELYNSPEDESFDVIEFNDGRIFERYSKPQISGDEIIGRVWSFRDVTERKKVEEINRERVTKMTRFQETVLSLTELKLELSLEEKLDQIIKLTSIALDVERVSVWLYNKSNSQIHADKIFTLSDKDFIPGFTLYKKDSPNYFNAIEEFPVIDADDALTDSRVSEFAETYSKRLGITSLLDTPIRTGGQIIGILCMEHTGPKRSWTHEEQVFASSIAGIVALSLEHDHRQKAEQKIRQSEEKYRFLAEAVDQLLYTAQPDGTIDFFNSKVYQYTGKDFKFLQTGWESLIHPDDWNKLDDITRGSIGKEEPWKLEFRILGKDNQYRWFLANATPQKDQNGNVLKWFGSLTDIDEQRQSIELVNKKNEELVRTNTDLDNFIYTASHDLKAPISNIEGLTNMLKEEVSPENDSIQSVLGLMEKSTERFKKTIEGLTDVAKIQKSGHEEAEKISFKELFKEVVDDIKEIKETKAVIETDFSSCPVINFSKKNLRSIIYNLLSNAVKYSSPDRTPVIKIHSEKTDGFTLLTIKDNGLGIELQNKDKIFKMFKRLHTHTEGTGVGLYIVKRIMDNTGGKIEIESKINEGTTFLLYFKNEKLS